MSEILKFENRTQFRNWLNLHCLSNDGVWLLFDKTEKQTAITAEEALEEALCFGCIDGQIQRIDDASYKKYFSVRRAKSKWSAKNKALANNLEERGLMTGFGRKKIEEAKQNGQWYAPEPAAVTDEQIALLTDVLRVYEPACTNFQAMPLSVKKTYVKAYLDAKTDTGREKRIAGIVDRLNKNLKPM